MTDFESNSSVHDEQFGETENMENKKEEIVSETNSGTGKNRKKDHVPDDPEIQDTEKQLKDEDQVRSDEPGNDTGEDKSVSDPETEVTGKTDQEQEIKAEEQKNIVDPETDKKTKRSAKTPVKKTVAENKSEKDKTEDTSADDGEKKAAKSSRSVKSTTKKKSEAKEEENSIGAANEGNEAEGVNEIAVEDDEKKSEDKKKVKKVKSEEVSPKKQNKDKPVEETKAPAHQEVKEEEQVTDKEEDNKKALKESHQPVQEQKEEEEHIDYAKLSKEDLVKVLKDFIDNKPVYQMKGEVESIKSFFYRKLKAENDQIKKKFLADGGLPEDFKLEESPVESELKELLNKYRDLKSEYAKRLEEEKGSNLEEKYRIIEEIKDLVNSQESLNKTFHDFRELQNRWRETGPVPQQNLKDLWESYHYHVEAFYDYIKINKELRDLDLKKNLEAKLELCEKAEELLLEPSVVEAFRRLQKLHDSWREIGPVPIDKRTEIWERFKEATTKINRKHQEYFVNLKQEQKKNYEEKLLLCEKAEEISALEIDNHKDWEEKSGELIELQKIWKTIGFAPKKHNTEVYERFRKACDHFFENKRNYYSQNREEQQNNLQLKTELCIQAEGLENSTDWKKTTDEFIALQKKWKEIGPVPAKISDKIWKRFRAACDVFFDNKAKFYSEIDSRYEENLEKKLKIIEEIETFKLTDDVEKNLKMLKDFQRQWSEIGFVPLKDKKDVQEKYRAAINTKFDMLRVDDGKKAALKFKSRLDNIMSKPNASQRLHADREKYFNKMKQLENDITLWENNIGFFANSKNAESMIADVQNKIENAKAKIEELRNKIQLIDDMDD